ncbi:glycerate kinase [uncultured Clostridium sp.]|uniref:glycerate kinase family protein n=1 Tax=uncultured Clostridium sp. TaxID=59620 RepID=UPI0025EE52A6|nr:glycerate kinase [uncultured Clostridium sp.]
MKFVLATDSFKESMTSIEACDVMEKAIKKVKTDAEVIKVPMADGGEGTVEALVNATSGTFVETEVLNPLGQKIKASYGILGDKKTAVIEMAKASGIELIKREERNPLITTTYGTGQLIKHALDNGIKHLVIGIGGSATNDGGCGMLQALGVKLLDKDNNEIPFGGGSLNKIETIDVSYMYEGIKDVTFEVACDVTNPFVGPTGASYIFGPQKGADEEMVELLDNNLKHFAEKIKETLNVKIAEASGAGAAGGLGGALLAFLNAELKSGIQLVIKYTNLEEKVQGADYVFTGEGGIDGQTIFGKTPVGVSKVAKKFNIPTIAFGGRVSDDADNLFEEGIIALFSIMRGVESLDDALKNGAHNLEKTVENVVRTLR